MAGHIGGSTGRRAGKGFCLGHEFTCTTSSSPLRRFPVRFFLTRRSSDLGGRRIIRSEEHTSELQSHGLISYAVFCCAFGAKPTAGDDWAARGTVPEATTAGDEWPTPASTTAGDALVTGAKPTAGDDWAARGTVPEATTVGDEWATPASTPAGDALVTGIAAEETGDSRLASKLGELVRRNLDKCW